MTVQRRCLTLLALVAVTACGTPGPTGDGSVEPIGDPSPNGVAPGRAGDCAPPAEPGPDDEPNRGGGDLIDLSDYGGARWRLCLAGPITASVEGTGSCTWDQRRESVNEVIGHDLRIGTIDYGVWVALSRGEFQLGTTDRARGGLVATYAPGLSQPFGDATGDGRVGQLAFDVTVMIDPEAGAPEGAPPRHLGSIRWICGDAPPPA